MEVSGLSISRMRPLERLYMATFSAYVTANKGGGCAMIVCNYEREGQPKQY